MEIYTNDKSHTIEVSCQCRMNRMLMIVGVEINSYVTNERNAEVIN